MTWDCRRHDNRALSVLRFSVPIETPRPQE
jgi:hypothetical protein